KSAMPLIARLFDSVAPEVQTISLPLAPMRRATCSRASSTADSARQPNTWLREAALPKSLVKKGSMRSRTRGSTGVVEWLSRKMGSLGAIAEGPLRGVQSGDEDRLLAGLVAVDVAGGALADAVHGGAAAAAFEVAERVDEIGFELLEAVD